MFPDLLLKGMVSGFSWWIEAADAVFDLSSCASCSGSCLPWLLGGLSLGFISAILLALVALFYFYFLPVFHRGFRSPVDFSRLEVAPKRPVEVDRRARLAAYVD